MFTVAKHPNTIRIPLPSRFINIDFFLELLICRENFQVDASVTITILVSLSPESTNIYSTRIHNMHFLLPLLLPYNNLTQNASTLSGS